MDRIPEDLRAAGIIGETKLALTVYLVGVSAQLPKPLACIVRGQTSSGKSFVVDRVADLFPPEVVLRATSITTNALYYFPPGHLRHRWVVAGERSRMEDDDRAEATRALREMLESGSLSKAVSVKEEGQWATKLLVQEGPIAYTETTSMGVVFEEDANRCLLLDTDSSREQTRRVLAGIALDAARRNRPDVQYRRDVHLALLRMVPRTDVVVPFADAVASLYPPDRVDARRSFRQLLAIIKASALLQFQRRQKDPLLNIVAEFDDYHVAETLARDAFTAMASGVTHEAVVHLDALRGKFLQREFDTEEAQAVGVGSRATKYRRLAELNSAGCLDQVRPSQGRVPARWRLTGIDPDTDSGAIPTLKDVMAAVSVRR